MKCSGRIKKVLEKYYSQDLAYVEDEKNTEVNWTMKTIENPADIVVEKIVAIVNDRLEKDGFTYRIT